MVEISSGWWYTYPSEKHDFVSWDDENPNWMESHKIHVSNHQSVIYPMILFYTFGIVFVCRTLVWCSCPPEKNGGHWTSPKKSGPLSTGWNSSHLGLEWIVLFALVPGHIIRCPTGIQHDEKPPRSSHLWFLKNAEKACWSEMPEIFVSEIFAHKKLEWSGHL
jgi:hypothetical protein